MNYKNVYFRLESGYQWGKGMDQNASDAFHNELNELFINAGWEIKEKEFSCSCPEAFKDKNRLYLHPQSASGELQEDLIPEVEKILSKGTTFKHYKTDVYETLFNMSDEEYQKILEGQEKEIRKDLLEGFKTKRSNLFITSSWAVIERVKEKYHIQRIQQHLGRSSDNLEWKYVGEIFNKMIEEGCFVTAETKNGKGFRTKTSRDNVA